jgi:hypothetical protein
MNTKAVADALAARFSGLTATGASSPSLAVGPTASLPNTIAKGPALLVYPPTGDLGITARLRDDTLTFRVRLLLDPLDVPTRSNDLYAWYDAMRDEVEKQMTLGLDYVAWAQPVAMRAELDGEDYAGNTFDVVELTVRVRFNEVVTTLAP